MRDNIGDGQGDSQASKGLNGLERKEPYDNRERAMKLVDWEKFGEMIGPMSLNQFLRFREEDTKIFSTYGVFSAPDSGFELCRSLVSASIEVEFLNTVPR